MFHLTIANWNCININLPMLVTGVGTTVEVDTEEAEVLVDGVDVENVLAKVVASDMVSLLSPSEHTTPASSECSQSCFNQSERAQSAMVSSFPEHSTSSRRMWTELFAAPKCASPYALPSL